MHPSEFTTKEKLISETRDFRTYDDRLLSAVDAWQSSGNRWNEIVRALYQTTTPEYVAEYEGLLATWQTEYAKHFSQAAHAVAADSPIEEVAVKTLCQLIRDEDQHRRALISKWREGFNLPEPDDAYINDLAMAFGDPEGVTDIDGSQIVLSGITAAACFTARLNEQASMLLGEHRISVEHASQANAQPIRRHLGRAAMSLIRRLGRRKDT